MFRGRKSTPIVIFGFCDDVDFMTACPAETGRIEAMSGRTGVFELTLEQDPSWALGQGGENLARAGNKPMQLERQKCRDHFPSRPRSVSGRLMRVRNSSRPLRQVSGIDATIL